MRLPGRGRDFVNVFPAVMLAAALGVTACVVGIRPLSVGADTPVYAEYFERYHRIFAGRFELGFSALTFWLKSLGVSTAAYFAILYVVMCAFFGAFVHMSCRQIKGRPAVDLMFLCFVFAALLFSRWFETASTNGVRQGIAAPLVYSALLLLQRRSFIPAFFFGAAALCFHASAALVFIISPLVFLRDRLQLVVFAASCAAYLLGASAGMVRALPPVLGVNLYQSIIDFAADSRMWVGPQYIFVAYTCFFMLIFYVAQTRLYRAPILLEYFRMYSVLGIMYFVFGFGAFSGRFAVYAWLFTSVPVARIAYEVTPNRLRFGLGAVGLFVATIYFSMRVSGIRLG